MAGEEGSLQSPFCSSALPPAALEPSAFVVSAFLFSGGAIVPGRFFSLLNK